MLFTGPLTAPRPSAAPAVTADVLHELTLAVAAVRPRATAAVHGGETLTYGALADRSGALAARLLAAGV
ncbi:MAG TPA: hypothetical protein VGD67_06700, partial [Pseudonocardiaceae bacterium]